MMKDYILKGNICYSQNLQTIRCVENGYVVCLNGKSAGVFDEIPEKYKNLAVKDFGDKLIIPGLVDMHVHAPQYSFRSIGMDMELLDWLEARAFPEEGKFSDVEYAKKAYGIFVDDLLKSATTRACIFASRHVEGTWVLMDLLEKSGLVSYVGKVNMDRNAPDYLKEENAEKSAEDTIRWIEGTAKHFQNTKPIITPRFIPSCTDPLMERLGEIQKEYNLPVQSHLSENLSEIELVKELCPTSKFYGDAYHQFGLFGGDVPTIMAHCVHPPKEEMEMMKEQGIFVAHCPQSNINVLSGIPPIRDFLDEGIRVGLGCDIAGGTVLSIFRAMIEAIQLSKLRWRLVDQSKRPLTVEEAFYLGTIGGGSFFGKVGSFEEGYELDAVVLDDTTLPYPQELTVAERLERMIYLSDERHVVGKFVRGKHLF
ncbi:amidohydrolase family protein [Anaerotignum sp.]|uniref:amidohydrolase family protein n=1 Tax=Anaerotignum sp. TaxID=2039241 RepID=UPI00332B6240